jgi:hypothetical protein
MMSDVDDVVLEAVSRGRLIFPFMEELEALRKTVGGLTEMEQARLARLEAAFEQVRGLDAAFHAAMAEQDLVTAEDIARRVLAVAEAVG